MASVIEGFLVSLGFQIDKDAYARFNASVEDAGKRMRSFATKTAGATAALAAAWTKTSSEISKSYQLSAATGASIRGTNALRTAIKAVGGDAGALDATLQTMAVRMQTIPGHAQQIQSVFGVSMTDATGKTRDMADVLADIGEKMQTMDPAMARAAAEATGLGGVWQQLIDKRFPDALARARAETDALGKSLDENAKATADLMNAFDSALDTMKLSAMSFVGYLNKEFNLSGWIHDQAKALAEGTETAQKWAAARIRAEARHGKEIKDDWRTFFDLKRFDEIFEEEKKKEGMSEAKGGGNSTPAATRPSAATPPAALQGPLPNTLGFNNKNPGNIRGSDGKFRTFSTFEEGFGAMARQVKYYQNAGAKNVRDIISTYAPSSENNTEAYIKSVVEYLRRELNADIDASTELDLSKSKILSAVVRGMIRQENGAGTDAYFRGASFEREAAMAAQATYKSKAFDVSKATPSTPAPVTINQQIYVTGQGAAEKIAATTSNSLEKASVVRNLTRGAT